MTWDEYLEQVKNAKNNNKNIMIYGAGKIGRRLCEKLIENQIIPKCFVVTDLTMNKDNELGVPVYSIYDLCMNKDEIFILIAVKKPWNQEIINKLDELNYKNYICATELLERLIEKPSLLEITTSVGCIVGCKYCPQKLLNKRYNGERMMSFSRFKEALAKIPGGMMLSFSGFSEPFLNNKTSDMILYAHKQGYKIKLNTTLVGMEQNDLEKIKDIPFYEVTLHLPDQDGNANIPMTKEYFSVLNEMLNIKKYIGKREENLIYKANCQGDIHRDIKKIVAGKLLIFSELADRAGNLMPDDRIYSSGLKKGQIFCNYSPSLDNHVLLPNGDVVLCCMDFGLQHKLGNIFMQSWDSIKKSSELKKIKKNLNSNNVDRTILCRYCSEAKSVDLDEKLIDRSRCSGNKRF